MLQQFSAIDLVCPVCLDNLRQEHQSLSCLRCQAHFDLEQDIPVMLADEFIRMKKDTANEFQTTDKLFMQELYNAVSKELSAGKAARVSQFLNFGYVPNENQQYAQPCFNNHIFNKNSVKLLGEAIGQIDLNGKRIIDIGCGRGGVLNIINKYFNPEISVGLDISFENIRFCRMNNKKETMLFLVGDAENLPFPHHCFDVAVNMESSLNYPNIRKFYSEAYRILRPGGSLIYTDSVPTSEISSRELFLKDLGFVIVQDIDATSNVLLSLEDMANRSALARKFLVNQDERLYLNENFLAMPGSDKYRLFKEGVFTYKIYYLRK